MTHRFARGPEVPRPHKDPSLTWVECTHERRAWQAAIEQAVRDHDAWGLLCTAPNCDVILRDVLTLRAIWAATAAHSVHLLLAHEATP